MFWAFKLSFDVNVWPLFQNIGQNFIKLTGHTDHNETVDSLDKLVMMIEKKLIEFRGQCYKTFLP
jgi:hypothetical protein